MNKFKNNNKIVDKLEVFNGKTSKRILSGSFFVSFPAICVQQDVLAYCPSLKYLSLRKCLSPSLCPGIFCLIKWAWWGNILFWESSRRAFKTASYVLNPSILVASHLLWARKDCCSYLLLSLSFFIFFFFLLAVVLLAAVTLANTSEDWRTGLWSPVFRGTKAIFILSILYVNRIMHSCDWIKELRF